MVDRDDFDSRSFSSLFSDADTPRRTETAGKKGREEGTLFYTSYVRSVAEYLVTARFPRKDEPDDSDLSTLTSVGSNPSENMSGFPGLFRAVTVGAAYIEHMSNQRIDILPENLERPRTSVTEK